eukprot:g156.t1
MCVEPENEAAERRFWRKEYHGNVNFINFKNNTESDVNSVGKFKVDNESRYERINIGDFGVLNDDDFLAEEGDQLSNAMEEDVKTAERRFWRKECGHSNSTDWTAWCAGNRGLSSTNDEASDDNNDNTKSSKRSPSVFQQDDDKDLMNRIYDGDSFEDNFTLLRQIGKGMIGQVFLITDKKTQVKHYAMKAMSKRAIVKRSQKNCVNL